MLQIRLGKVDERLLDERAGRMGMNRSAFVRYLIRFGEVNDDCSDNVMTDTTRGNDSVVTNELQKHYDGPVEVGDLEDWLGEFGILRVLADRREDSELDWDEPNSMTRAQIKGEVLKMRKVGKVKRGDVKALADKFNLKY